MFLANVVWPALFLTERILTWWAIGLGLPIEYLAVRQITQFNPKKAIITLVVINLASSLLGIVLIPFVGIIWEVFPGILLFKLFNWGTFNPLTWIANLFLAGLVNAFVEGETIKRIFKYKLTRKEYILLFIANLITVGVALASLALYPPKYYR